MLYIFKLRRNNRGQYLLNICYMLDANLSILNILFHLIFNWPWEVGSGVSTI